MEKLFLLNTWSSNPKGTYSKIRVGDVVTLDWHPRLGYRSRIDALVVHKKINVAGTGIIYVLVSEESSRPTKPLFLWKVEDVF
jgi:hypothetical protein